MLQSTTGKPMFAATLWLVLPQHSKVVTEALRPCLESAQDCEAGMTVLLGDVIGIRLLAIEGLTIRKLMRQLRVVISAASGRFQTDMRKL
jgi:urease accessory protein UreH